jgi:hypothetical protein
MGNTRVLNQTGLNRKVPHVVESRQDEPVENMRGWTYHSHLSIDKVSKQRGPTTRSKFDPDRPDVDADITEARIEQRDDVVISRGPEICEQLHPENHSC